MSRFRMPATGAAIAALALAALFLSPTAASAHDQLISSTPAEGASLDASPTTVQLDFSSEIMTDGAEIRVVDATLTDYTTGELVIDGATASIAVTPDLPDAGYQVRWRVVSSDGHPISGIVPFTVGAASPLPLPVPGQVETPAAPVTTPAPETSVTSDSSVASESSVASATTAPTGEEDGVLRTVLIGAGGAVIALALVVLIARLRGRRQADASSEDDAR